MNHNLEALERRVLLASAAANVPLPAASAVTGVIFSDDNANGRQEAAEHGIANIRVFVDRNSNGAPDPAEPMAVTDSAGRFTIGSLPAGQATVRASLPRGAWQVTSAPFSAVTLQPLRTTAVAFGLRRLQVEGLVFMDRNGNGQRDAGEEGLSGVAISAYEDPDHHNTYSHKLKTVTTNASGRFVFDDLAAGTYALRADNGNRWAIQTNYGRQWGQSILATPQPPGSQILLSRQLTPNIHGEVFFDRNGDRGHQGGEEPLAGIPVYLDSNANDRLDAGERFVFTDAQGRYRFDELQVANYRLRVDGLSYINGEQYQGAVIATAAPNEPGYGAYNAAIPAGSFRGRVFNDRNGDRAWDDRESMGGWQVFLDENNNARLDPGEQTTFADSQGLYRFDNLFPKSYTVRVSGQQYWRSTLNGGGVTANAIWGNRYNPIDFGKAYVPPNAVPAPTSLAGRVLTYNNGGGSIQFNADGTYVSGGLKEYLPRGTYTYSVTPSNAGNLILNHPGSVYEQTRHQYYLYFDTGNAVNVQSRTWDGAKLTENTAYAINVTAFWDTDADGVHEIGDGSTYYGNSLYLDVNGNGVADGPDIFARGSDTINNLLAGTYTVRYGGATSGHLTTPDHYTVTVGPDLPLPAVAFGVSTQGPALFDRDLVYSLHYSNDVRNVKHVRLESIQNWGGAGLARHLTVRDYLGNVVTTYPAEATKTDAASVSQVQEGEVLIYLYNNPDGTHIIHIKDGSFREIVDGKVAATGTVGDPAIAPASLAGLTLDGSARISWSETLSLRIEVGLDGSAYRLWRNGTFQRDGRLHYVVDPNTGGALGHISFDAPVEGLTEVPIVFTGASTADLGQLIPVTVTANADHFISGGVSQYFSLSDGITGPASFTRPKAGLTVYLDGNNNGQLDAGERTAVTNSDGEYVFDSLADGTYTVRPVMPSAEWGSEAIASRTVTIADGVVAGGQDFRVQYTGSPLGAPDSIAGRTFIVCTHGYKSSAMTLYSFSDDGTSYTSTSWNGLYTGVGAVRYGPFTGSGTASYTRVDDTHAVLNGVNITFGSLGYYWGPRGVPYTSDGTFVWG